ncbi:hypothetical protein DOTSEDRAFT_80744, partial [Dothistroma septosporum NZE10]
MMSTHCDETCEFFESWASVRYMSPPWIQRKVTTKHSNCSPMPGCTYSSLLASRSLDHNDHRPA